MLCDYSLRTEPHKPFKAQMCLRLLHGQRNIDKLYLSSFLLTYIIIIYRLLTRHTTIVDYLTTIPRLSHDYSTCGAAAGNTQALPEIAFYSRKRVRTAKRQNRGNWRCCCPPVVQGGTPATRRHIPAHSCCNICNALYLRRNCPLNARKRIKGIRIYPGCKRAVYAQFLGGIWRGEKNTALAAA